MVLQSEKVLFHERGLSLSTGIAAFTNYPKEELPFSRKARKAIEFTFLGRSTT